MKRIRLTPTLFVVLTAVCMFGAPPLSRADLLYDDFDDGNYDGWLVYNPYGDPTATLTPVIVSSPQGYAIKGVGSGYGPLEAACLVRPLALSGVVELSIEMRARSGSSHPTHSTIALFSGDDWLAGYDYGEFDLAAFHTLYGGQPTDVLHYPILANPHDWHDFKWSRDAQGWWSLSIDGSVVAPNFVQDTTLTSFDAVALTVVRQESEIEWIRVSVPQPANNPPVAVDDPSARTDPDQPVTIAVLVNDYDPDPGDTVRLVSVTQQPNYGTAHIAAEQIQYTPDECFHGTDAFNYAIEDDAGLSSTATVTVTVDIRAPQRPLRNYEFFSDFNYDNIIDPRFEACFVDAPAADELWTDDAAHHAQFCTETVDHIEHKVMLLKASRHTVNGTRREKTSRVETRFRFGWTSSNPAGTYAAYVQYNDPDPLEAFEDINDQSFYGQYRTPQNNSRPEYSEVDFEWLTLNYWNGRPRPESPDGTLHLNSHAWKECLWDPDNVDFANIGPEPMDGRWTLLLFRVAETAPHHVQFYRYFHGDPESPAALFETTKENCAPDSAMELHFSNWFHEGENGEGIFTGGQDRTYTMKVDWVYYSPRTDLSPIQIEGIVNDIRDDLRFTCMSPVDLVVHDDLGGIVSKNQITIPGATYVEEDVNGDGSLDDTVTIPDPGTGGYTVEIVVEAGADPEELVAFLSDDHGDITYHLRDVRVVDLPTEPFVFDIDRTPPELAVSVAPTELDGCDGGMVTLQADVLVQDTQDPAPRVFLGAIEVNADYAPDDIQEAEEGTDDREFQLRATLNPDGSERVYTIHYVAVDATGNTAEASATVSAADFTPPTVTCTVATDVLWAPDHRLVDVGLTVTVEDDCDGSVPAEPAEIQVYADESEVPETGDGTGRHAPDAKLLPEPLTLPVESLRLRNERRGQEDGRVYLIVAKAVDSSGNVGFAYCTVVVPHDQSQAGLDLVSYEADAAVGLLHGQATTIEDMVSPLGYVKHGVSEPLGPHQ